MTARLERDGGATHACAEALAMYVATGSLTRKIGAKRVPERGAYRLHTFRARYATDLQNLDAVAYLGRVEAVGTA